MDKIIFKEKIDRIYEKVYSINENLSFVDSKEFKKGFRDGINEGIKLFNDNINEWNLAKAIGKGLGTVSGAAKGIYNQGKQLYQQGKEMAHRVWNTVADFYNDVIQGIKKGILDAANWLSEQPAKVKEFLTKIYNDAVDKLKSAYETLKDKSAELAQAITNIWNQVVASIKSGIETAKAKILQTEESAKAWFEKNKQIVINQINELKQSTIEWLKQAGETALQVYQEVEKKAVSFIKGVGILISIVVLGPIYLLVLGIQKVPELYKATQSLVEKGLDQLSAYWEKLGQEYNAGHLAGVNAGLSATTPAINVPVRDPKTGRMMPAGTPVPEHRILKFAEFVNEKKKLIFNKEEGNEEPKPEKKGNKDGKCPNCHKKMNKCTC